MIKFNSYQQIRQPEIEGKNLEELEIRHPAFPNVFQDKNTRLDNKKQNKNPI